MVVWGVRREAPLRRVRIQDKGGKIEVSADGAKNIAERDSEYDSSDSSSSLLLAGYGLGLRQTASFLQALLRSVTVFKQSGEESERNQVRTSPFKGP